MKYSIATVAVALIAAAAAPNASASIVEHATEQRELWGKDWYKWTPNEPEECYDVRAFVTLFYLRLVSFSSTRSCLIICGAAHSSS